MSRRADPPGRRGAAKTEAPNWAVTGRVDSPDQPRFTAAVAASLLAAAALAAYANSFSGPFVFDDIPTIRDNPALHHFGTLWAASAGQGLTTAGRPLVALSLALNYAVSGTAVWSYHALNLAIHLLAGLALFGVVRRTLDRAPARSSARRSSSEGGPLFASRTSLGRTKATLLAFAIALLWIVHPLQTESVTYIVQRAESLMGLFYLLTLYCFIRGVQAGVDGPASARGMRVSAGEKAAGNSSILWFGASWLVCLFGMATKEVMVSAPLIVFLYDRTFVSGTFAEAWRRHRRIHLALASSWILLLCLAAANGDRGRTAGFHAGVAWGRYALAQFPAVLRYLRLSLWPHPLVFDYGRNLAGLAATAVPCALAVGALLAGTLLALVRRPALGFLGACFFGLLAPTSSVVPVATEVVAEHRMYLPLAAVVILAVLALRKAPRALFLPLVLSLAAGLGMATVRRNLDYRSDLALWGKTAAQDPENADAQYNFGLALDQAGRAVEAVGHFAAAVRLDPEFAQAQNNLALDLERLGRTAEALGHFEAAARLRPDLVETQNDLGNVLLRSGRVEEAIAHYRTALQWQPHYALTHLNLGQALTQAQRLGEAAGEFQLALRLQPDFPEAYFDLGNVHAESGENEEAIDCYEAALRLRPDFADARTNLDVVLARRQNPQPPN